nr:hypothetical protein [uncultured Desulfobacter sp.]
MEINRIQTMKAYAANSQMAETVTVRNTNKEATGVVTDKQSTQTLQEAFQVDITPQALTLQAQREQEMPQEEQEMETQLNLLNIKNQEMETQPTLQNFKTQQMEKGTLYSGYA